MKKGIKKANTVACKLELALTRATNKRLKVSKKKRRKKAEMMER